MNRFSLPSLAALLIGLCLFTASCKKEVDPLTPGTETGDKTPVFVGPNWQMTAFLLDPSADFDGDGKVDSDLLPFMDACDRDNTMKFSPNGQIITSEGAIRCDNEPTETGKPGTWEYNKTTKTLKIIDGGDVSTWEVIDASARILKIKTSVTEDGQTLNATIHWKSV